MLELDPSVWFALQVFVAATIAQGICITLVFGHPWGCKGCSKYNFIYSPDAWTKHTSQHAFDPYSLSHIEHGLLLYTFAVPALDYLAQNYVWTFHLLVLVPFVFFWSGGSGKAIGFTLAGYLVACCFTSIGSSPFQLLSDDPFVAMCERAAISFIIESLWEVAENTDLVIKRYRVLTASTDYFGDSGQNSVGDSFCSAFGVLGAIAIQMLMPTELFEDGWFPWVILTVVVATDVILTYSIRDGLGLNLIMLFFPLPMIRNWQDQAVKAEKRSADLYDRALVAQQLASRVSLRGNAKACDCQYG